MPYFKDPVDNLYFLDNPVDAYVLPKGCVQITDAEAKVIQEENIPIPNATDNQATASYLLSNTDWTTIADIGTPTANPRLINQDEFIAYRQLVRQIAVNPTSGNLNWPLIPTEIWS